MLSKERGKIINIASIASFQRGINVIAYAASKHGIVDLTRALANDWAARGINLNAIAPGFFETKFTKTLHKDPERYEEIIGRTPLCRWGKTEGIAGAAVFSASPASDFVNSVILAALWMVYYHATLGHWVTSVIAVVILICEVGFMIFFLQRWSLYKESNSIEEFEAKNAEKKLARKQPRPGLAH